MTHEAPSPNGGRRPWRLPWWHTLFALALVGLTVAAVYLMSHRGRPVSLPAGAAAQVSAETLEVFAYSADELSALADFLPDLDEGRVRAAPPVDWHVASRDPKCVARFLFDRAFPLPRITIEARAASFPQPRDVRRENLLEFRERLLGSLEGKMRQAMEGQCWALVLGDVPCIAYRTQQVFQVGSGRYGADREVLVTLRNGRLYTVILDVQAGQLDDYRADAWAVMAGLKFL